MGDKENVLLNWCKNQVKGYARVEIKDFTTSWQDGLAFCALVDSLRPGKINTKILTSVNPTKNLKLAFDTASSMGVPKMLDDAEMLEKPDEDSVVTYITSIYHLMGESNDGSKKELDPAKEKLKSVQNELMALKEKLVQSKKQLQEKENAKKKLERKVDHLKNVLENEKNNNKMLEDEHNRKIDKLKNSLETATGGAKLALLEQLKTEIASKANLKTKQENLEKEVHELKNQLKEEEKKSERTGRRDKEEGGRKETFRSSSQNENERT